MTFRSATAQRSITGGDDPPRPPAMGLAPALAARAVTMYCPGARPDTEKRPSGPTLARGGNSISPIIGVVAADNAMICTFVPIGWPSTLRTMPSIVAVGTSCTAKSTAERSSPVPIVTAEALAWSVVPG